MSLVAQCCSLPVPSSEHCVEDKIARKARGTNTGHSVSTNQEDERCNVCGWPDGPCEQKKRESSFFYIYLRKNFLRSMIDNMVDKVMFVATHEQKEYAFKLQKGVRKTRIFGHGYNKFPSDYKMKRGDRIRFHLDQAYPFVKILPQEMGGDNEQEGLPKEPHVFEDSATVVVFSGGLELTAAQTSRMNHCVLTRGLGLGVVFVHTLTKSDVQGKGQRISKDIVSALNIYKKGYAILTTENENNNNDLKETRYHTCIDGRVCLQTGWFNFAKENGFKVGIVMLTLFDKGNDDYLNISFDVL